MSSRKCNLNEIPFNKKQFFTEIQLREMRVKADQLEEICTVLNKVIFHKRAAPKCQLNEIRLAISSFRKINFHEMQFQENQL